MCGVTGRVVSSPRPEAPSVAGLAVGRRREETGGYGVVLVPFSYATRHYLSQTKKLKIEGTGAPCRIHGILLRSRPCHGPQDTRKQRKERRFVGASERREAEEDASERLEA